MGLSKRLGKKKSLLDQAGDYVEQVRPRVEAAYGSARDYVSDTALPALADAKDQAADKAGPALSDARGKARPVLADARHRAAAGLADARDKAAPLVASGAAVAAARAGEAKGLAETKVAKLKGEPEPKKGRLKKFVLFAAIAGAVAFVAKKLQGGSSSSDNWQSSYTPPSPPPRTPAAPVTPAAPGSGADQLSDDPGGASPDEALADAAEAPHPVTTPEEPAEVVDIEDQPKP